MTKSNVVSGKNQSFYKSYFSMTLVIALQNLVVYSVSLADNVMLGGYSELALSGVALCNQIQYFLQMTVMGIGAAMVVLASQFWGKKDTQSVQKIIAVGFWVAVAVSMLLWCAAFFFPHGCLGLLTDDQEVIGEGVKYLKIICFTYVFFGMTNTLLAGLRSVETVRIGFLVSGSTLVINVCLNYLLIYGNFGAPGWVARARPSLPDLQDSGIRNHLFLFKGSGPEDSVPVPFPVPPGPGDFEKVPPGRLSCDWGRRHVGNRPGRPNRYYRQAGRVGDCRQQYLYHGDTSAYGDYPWFRQRHRRDDWKMDRRR
ncbi:MAG: MATE family efflux transporter [[Clostridium] leptum]